MEFGNIQNRETTETQSRLVDLQGWRSREVIGKRYQLSTVLKQCCELASLSTIQMLLLLLLLLFRSLGNGGLAHISNRVREQFRRAGSLLLPRGSWGLNSGHRACQQVPFSTEPSLSRQLLSWSKFPQDGDEPLVLIKRSLGHVTVAVSASAVNDSVKARFLRV